MYSRMASSKNIIIIIFLLVLSCLQSLATASPLLVKNGTGNEKHLKDFTPFCPDSGQSLGLNIDELYEGQVQEGQHCLMTFKKFDKVSQHTHLRLEVTIILPPSAVNTNGDTNQSLISLVKTPLTVAILNRYDLNKIILPLEISRPNNTNIKLLFSASRIICFQYDTIDDGSSGEMEEEPTDIDILFHTDSNNSIHFEMSLRSIDIHKLELNSKINLTITPSSPMYVHFDFKSASGHGDLSKNSLNSVMVVAHSESESCMTLSIQRPMCPNYDRESNVKFEGVWQTVTKLGAINVMRDQEDKEFENGFYVVLVLHHSSIQCHDGQDDANLLKNVTVQVLKGTPNPTKAIILPIIITVLVCLIPISYMVIPCCQWKEGVSWYEFYLKKILHERSKEEAATVNATPQPEVSQQNAPKIFVSDLSNEKDSGHHPQSSYPCLLFIMIVFFTLPVLQLLRHNLQIFWETGNFDFCYYNFLCAHPLQAPLFNFYDGNHIISNLPYILFGLSFFIISTKRAKVIEKLSRNSNQNIEPSQYGAIASQPDGHQMPVTMDSSSNNNFQPPSGHNQNATNSNGHDTVATAQSGRQSGGSCPPQTTSDHGLPLQENGVYQGMGLALAMEGVMSATYHICPTQANFQFDTCYMYVISFLGIVKILQFRHAVHPGSHTAFILLAIFSIMSVIGVIVDSNWNDAHRSIIYGIFCLIHWLTLTNILFIMYYIGVKVSNGGSGDREENIELVSSITDQDGDGVAAGSRVVPQNSSIVLFDHLKLSEYPRNICRHVKLIFWNNQNYRKIVILSRLLRSIVLIILNVWLTVTYMMEQKNMPRHLLNILLYNFGVLLLTYILWKFCECQWTVKSFIFWQSVIYFLIFVTLFGVAYAIFFKKFLAQWETTAALSKEGNANCDFLDYYDSHDEWHFLSAISLYAGFMFLFTLDDDLLGMPQNKIYMF